MFHIASNANQMVHTATTYCPVNLSEYFNNDAISYDDLKSDGAFDGPGATYPAEELPDQNTIILVDGIPFNFPAKAPGYKNNLTLTKLITIPIIPAYYESLFVMGASEGQNGEVLGQEIVVTFEDRSSEFVYFGLSNWLLEPEFGERIAFRCSHLHFPDPGQITNENTDTDALFVDYVQPEEIQKYNAVVLAENEVIKGVNVDWKPKIYLQKVKLPSQKRIVRIEFEEPNPKLHLFSMTLKTIAKNG